MADLNKTKEQDAKEITEQIKQADELAELEQMLKNNIIIWDVDGITYRVRKPNYREREEIRKERIRKHNELRKDPNYKYEAQLIKEYEAKGINIAGMEQKMLEITHQIETLQLKLAEFGNASEKDTQAIVTLKAEIFNLMTERAEISLEKGDLLSESIQNELLIFVNSYTCYLILEKKINEDWTRAFESYEEFMNSDNDKLLGKAGHYLNLLIFKLGQENG